MEFSLKTRYFSVCKSVLICAIGGFSQVAVAGDFTRWLSPVDGNWEAGIFWDTGVVPGINDDVVLGHAGGYLVSVNSLSSVASVSITNEHAALAISNSSSLYLYGDVFNQGEILVSDLNGPSPTYFYIRESMSLNGEGILRLPALSGNSRINSLTQAVLTHGPMHTIEGQGFIMCNILNQGTIRSNVPGKELTFLVNPIQNEGRIEAVNQGILTLFGSVEQSGSGIISASGVGSEIRLGGSVYKGGVISATAGAEAVVISNSDIEDMTIEGRFIINPYKSLGVTGPLINNGEIALDEVFQTVLGSLIFQSDSLIQGSGEILLGTESVGIMAAADEGMILTNGSGHTIRGNGRILSSLVNDGLIHADVPGGSLSVGGNRPVVNNSIIKASNQSAVNVAGGNLVQGIDGIVLADGPDSVARISGGVFGGRVQSLNGGLIDIRSSTVLDGVEIVDGSEVVINWPTEVQNRLTNNGAVQIDSNNRINALSNTVLDGSGEVNLISPWASIHTAPGASLIQAADHTIRGHGVVSGSMVNNGRIVADAAGQTLELSFYFKSNNGSIEAVNGGTLYFEEVHIDQGASGVIGATGKGSVLRLDEAEITGGTLTVADGAVFEYGDASTFGGVTLHGELDLVNTMLTVSDSLTNQGRITVRRDEDLPGILPKIQFANEDVLLDGVGAVVLDDVQTDSPLIETVNDGVIINGVGHTIEGRGRIAALLENGGLLSANVPGGRLSITGSSAWSGVRTVNDSVVEAINGAELHIDSMTQTANGVIRADGAGSVVSMNGSFVLGRLESTNGGLVSVDSECTLTSVAMQAQIQIQSGVRMKMLGDITNNDVIEVNPLAGDEITTLQWGSWANPQMSIGGEGVIRLAAPGDRARIFGLDGIECELGPDQRLEGVGQISMSLFHAGTIAPGLGIGTMTAVRPVEFLSTARFEAEIAVDSNDLFESTQSVVLDGVLNVELVDGFSNSTGYWARTILSASSITGAFTEIHIPEAAEGFRTRYYNTGTEFVVGQGCLSDLSFDGSLNFLDVAAFLVLFGDLDADADLNDDGQWNFIDISLFLQDLSGGCVI